MKLDNLNKVTVTVPQIQKTDEYKDLAHSTAESHLVAGCIIYLRGDFPAVDLAVAQAKMQMQVAHTAWRELINTSATMIWQPSGPTGNPATNNDFIKLIRGTGSINLRNGSCVMNCWEAVITTAMFDGQLTNPKRLEGIYESSQHSFTAELVHAFTGNQRLYQPAHLLGTPIMGDVVLFDGLGHVALATERTTLGPTVPPTYPGKNVISFWPAPSQANFGPGTHATVEETTIESITTYATTHNMGHLQTTFGSPNWHALNG